MIYYSNSWDGIRIEPPSDLELMWHSVENGNAARWRVGPLDRVCSELFGTTFADFYANGADRHKCRSVIELAQLYELIELFGEGRNFTKGASARAAGGEPVDARSVKWSLMGGIRKIGSNLRKAMEVAVPNLPAFNEQADWPEIRALLVEQCKQLVNQIKGE